MSRHVEGRILIVDDDRDFADSLGEMLTSLAYRTTVAYSASEAIEAARRDDPELALVDIRLGGENGIEVLVRLRTVQPGLVVIMMTAYAEVDSAVAALRRGAYDYLRKPLDTATLCAAVDRGLERLRLLREKAHAEVQRDRLATAIEQAYQAVLITDDAGKIEYVNPGFCRLSGFSANEAVGRDVREITSGGDGRDVDSKWLTCLRLGRSWSGHASGRRKDGTTFESEITVSPLRCDNGVPAGGVVLQRDVTREVALAEQLRQAQKMEAVGQLAGGIAHDFNNILTAILSGAELLRESLAKRLPDEDAALTQVAQIERSGQRAAGLTRRLLAFARRQPTYPEVLDINHILDDVEAMLRRLVREDVVFDIRPAQGLWYTHADAGQIEQVIMNLAINAGDAMPRGGTLKIETANVEFGDARAVEPTGPGPGRYVSLTVSDTGCGMDADTRARAFEPFFTTKPDGQGTGLGLAMVHGIIKQTGGYIAVESEPGQGTTFTVYLPAVSGPAALRPTPQPAAETATGRATVLVCEDDAGVRSLTGKALRSRGYTVIEAERPEVAIQTAAAGDVFVDLLVSDVVMPGMHGTELADALRNRHDNLKVLFISGYSPHETEHPVTPDPNTAFLRKPFSTRSLLRCVGEMLDQGTTAPQATAGRPAASTT